MLKRRKQSGFTLLEVMMGSVLLAAATAGSCCPLFRRRRLRPTHSGVLSQPVSG
jgi:prepilin-type N-terminal cleavage/methylation domain-containing protein